MRSLGFGPVPTNSLVLSRERFVGADFSHRKLAGFSSEGCRFERCRFDGTEITSASFGGGRLTSEYVDCTFDGASLNMLSGGYARFVNCSFEKVNVRNWFCFAVELVGCTFSGRLQKVVFNGAVPPDDREFAGRTVNRIEDNDFSRAKFLDVGFRTGVDLGRQKLPSGPEYVYLDDAASAVRRARLAFNSWDEPDLKSAAAPVLAVLEEDIARGQRQLIVRIDDYPRKIRPALRRLMEAATGT